MGYRNVLRAFVILLFTASKLSAQNFSGLQYKNLSRADDLGSAFESLLGRIGGSVDGNIDSVVVFRDYEKELRVKIYYTGFQNAFFTVSTMSQSRKEEPWINVVKFSQTEKTSPAEAVLMLNEKLPEDAFSESPYLRIDISKRQDGGGKVRIYSLRKTWKANASGIIRINLQPVGVAANLSQTEVRDVMPSKKLRFDNKVMYEIRDSRKGVFQPVKTSGGNAWHPPLFIPELSAFADINGKWMNYDPNGWITYVMITNNINLSVVSKDSRDGHHYQSMYGTLVQQGANQYYCKLTLATPTDKVINAMTLFFNGENLNVTYTVKVVAAPNTSTASYSFYRNKPVTPVNTNPGGPNKNSSLNLWNEIAVDNSVDFDRPQDISNINMTVFQDINPKSGIYYILPADYHLLWNPDSKERKGYGFNISYGNQGDGSGMTATEAPVLIKATLTSGITNRDRNFVKTLLKAIDPDFKDIKFLPLKENIQSTFQNTLAAQFNIPADKIIVNSSTELTNDISVTWRTNPDTKEFIQTALTSSDGIVATMILTPADNGIVAQQIPAIISLSTTRTLGKMNLEPATWRDNEWMNSTAYPLKLKYLHVMKKAVSGNTPIIYSWSVGDVDVPSGGRVRFEQNPVPKWLDSDPSSVMWLSYAVNKCDSCNNDIINAVTDGVSNSTVQQLRFVIPDAVFDSLKASSFIVTVRSKQADPKGEAVVELPAMTITKEPGKNFMIGPLFIPKGASPDFEYKIILSSKDGDFYSSDKWVRSGMKEIYLGKTPLQDMFRGIVPWIN